LVRNSITLLFTGHLLDHASRLEPRFPFALLEDARAVLKSEIERIVLTHEPEIAICSLAAGGDMIFAEEMVLLKIPLIVFLPFEVEEFLRLSVTYDKGKGNETPRHWAVHFQKIIRQAQKVIITGTDNVPQEEALTLCNEKMLAHALRQSGGNPQKVLALALIKPADKIKRGGSSEFIKLIKAHGVAVKQVWPA
jgi:hypothetical protein